MCDCASCKHTDSFRESDFAAWPTDDPKGPAKARAEYSATRAVPDFTISQEPVYQCNGTPGCGPVASMPAWWYAWNNKSERPDMPAVTRPADPCKDRQHLLTPNRERQPNAKIYEMAKEKAKRAPGRPAMFPKGLKRRLVSLDVDSYETAKKLGDGNISAGIRQALSRR